MPTQRATQRILSVAATCSLRIAEPLLSSTLLSSASATLCPADSITFCSFSALFLAGRVLGKLLLEVDGVYGRPFGDLGVWCAKNVPRSRHTH